MFVRYFFLLLLRTMSQLSQYKQDINLFSTYTTKMKRRVVNIHAREYQWFVQFSFFFFFLFSFFSYSFMKIALRYITAYTKCLVLFTIIEWRKKNVRKEPSSAHHHRRCRRHHHHYHRQTLFANVLCSLLCFTWLSIKQI